MSISSSEFLILGLVPLGQLYARIVKFNGSLDKKWSLLPFFMVPPLQFIPIFMMKMGMIKKGKGGKPYDWFMLIPLIVKLILAYFIDKLNLMFPLPLIINIVVSFVSILIPYLIRVKKLCTNYNTQNVVNSMSQSALIEAVASIFSIVIGFIPIVGIVFSLLKIVPVVGKSLPWMIAYAAGYMITNMLNGDDPNKFCFENKYNMGVFLISLAVSGVLKFFKF